MSSIQPKHSNKYYGVPGLEIRVYGPRKSIPPPPAPKRGGAYTVELDLQRGLAPTTLLDAFPSIQLLWIMVHDAPQNVTCGFRGIRPQMISFLIHL